jgi:hypothetical protein
MSSVTRSIYVKSVMVLITYVSWGHSHYAYSKFSVLKSALDILLLRLQSCDGGRSSDDYCKRQMLISRNDSLS